MNSLIGTIVLCNITFTSLNPVLKRAVSITAENVKCVVTDDRIMKVGDPMWKRSPVYVDCSKEIAWLNPTSTDGIFMFFKEDNDCDFTR